MKHKLIQFLNIFPLRGPNIWNYRPSLEAWVDIGDLEDCPSNTIPGFVDRLCAWIPTLSEHRCSYGEPGGFIKRLNEGTWPAHILEHVTLELQSLAGMPGGFGKARETGVRGVYKLVVRSDQEDITRASLEEARDLVMAAIEDRPFDTAAAVERISTLAKRYILDPSTACIVAAAEAKDRRIPTIRLSSSNNYVQLGYGVRQRRICGAKTDLTGAIAECIACDVILTDQLLKNCGLPVPERYRAANVAEAWEAAEEIGLPVQIKPESCAPDEPGTTVSTREELDAAFQIAASAVVVEKPVSGTRYLLTVMGGNLVAATRMSDGVDITPQIHPATAEAACLAAKIVGLDIAGVYVVLEDVSNKFDAIISVQSAPALVTQPSTGEPHPIGRSIIDGLFPKGNDGRIPIVGVTGSGRNTEVARLIAEFSRLGGKLTGLACADGLFFNRRQVETTDCANWHAGRRVLINRTVEAAVVENGADVILGEGLAYDRCQIGVVTCIVPETHYGKFYIDSPERVFAVMRTQVDVILPDGAVVLDAADPMAAELAALCDGEVIYFATDDSLLTSHLAKGGRAVCIRDSELVLASPAEDIPISQLDEIPFISGDSASERLSSVLAAVAAAWALDIALHVIRTGVGTFPTELSDLIHLPSPETDA
jgi:cyanophycin synthetase